MKDRVRSLAQFPLFRTLNPQNLSKIEAACAWRAFEPGETLLDNEDVSRDVYFVIQGSVRVLIHSSNGKEVLLRQIGAGEFFGELAAIDSKPRSASIIAENQGLLARMAPDTFRSTIHAHSDVCDQILLLLASEVRRLAQRVNEHTTLSVRGRLIAELIRLARRRADAPNTGVISPPPRHQDLAARIGSHRERVTKDLRQLETLGLLERDRQRFLLRDIKALSAAMEARP